MGDMVIVGYRPKPGKEAALDALLIEHVPYLRALGLATDRPALAMRAGDGTMIEIFEWRSGGMEAAHGDPRILALWARYAEVCDYVPVADVAEARTLFSRFAPIEQDRGGA